MMRWIPSTMETDAEREWRYGGANTWGRVKVGPRATWISEFQDQSALLWGLDFERLAVVENLPAWLAAQP